MAGEKPTFSLGIEEEYLLVNQQTRDLERDPPKALLKDCQHRMKGRVSPEFMRCQIEVGTPVCKDIGAARKGNSPSSAITCRSWPTRMALPSSPPRPIPSPAGSRKRHTHRKRYDELARDMGVPLRRLLICANHVHVGINDDNLRIDLMNQVRYFLPHLLALSTSSPFWQAQDTRLKSYRLAVFNEMPRTGMPEEYQSFGEYKKHIDALVLTKVIEDGTKIWWDVRPSARFPTLEMRICDISTTLEDGIAIAALYQCLLRMLWRLKRMNVTWRRYNTLLINENRWRAMRHGFDEGLIDFGRGEMVPYGDLLEEILELVKEDAEALGCEAEIAHTREIRKRGTSAHRQLAVYQQARADGADTNEALVKVVDWLIEETLVGVD